MKLIFIHSGTDLYGASRSLLRLSSRLGKDGHSVKVVLPGDGLLKKELNLSGIDTTILPNLVTITRGSYNQGAGFISLILKTVASSFQLLRLIRKHNPDLVHSMTAVLPGSGLAALLAGKPHFWHIRESFDEFPALWRIYQAYIFLLSKKILCVSTPIANQFSPRYRNKISVLHNGFPRREFEPVSQVRINNTRLKWGLDEKSIAIGVVGRIKMKRKGQEIFVQAAAIVKNKFPEARFLCIGSPFPGNDEHLDQLLSLVKKLNLEKEFIYTGEAEDIKAAMAALDILVLSSVQAEPFGGVVIEAMAFKKPVVATAIGGSLEQVDDGQTGYLVQPGDPQEMAAALIKLLSDAELREKMGSNGYKRYLEYFEFEPFYKKISDLYLEAIQRSN